jgi:L-ascorbate metabolism protein UlaG (beta-lactamase superfamily)
MANLTIEWYGLGAVKITAKQTVGEVSVLTDPFGAHEGVKMPRAVTADIVIFSDAVEAKECSERVAGSPFVISHPGEYESKGVFVYGFDCGGLTSASEKNKNSGRATIYRIELDDFTLVFLGGARQALTDQDYDRFSEADILFLPVGDKSLALSAKEAVEVMNRIEPRVVVPIMYKIPGLAKDLDPVDKFVKESGVAPEKVEKLKLAKKDLPEEETKLYILSA